MSHRARIKRGCIALAVTLVAAALCEIALSNGGYFIYHRRGDSPVWLTETADSSTALPAGSGFLTCDTCEQIDLTVNAPVHALQFSVLTPYELPTTLYQVSLCLSYPGDETHFFTAVTRQIAVGREAAVYTVNIPAEYDYTAAAVRIEVTGDTMLCFNNITANPAYRFSFNGVRFSAAYALIAALSLALAFGLFRVPFDIKKKSHRVFAACTAAVCVGCALLFVTVLHSGEKEATPYPLEKEVSAYNPYVQQFDAFMKGQAALDCEPNEELLALENPYDKQSRTGISYLWDRALYNGKYYSYFGIGPILTLYAPYYALTHTLPADRTVTGVFTVMASLFWSLSVFAWVTVFKKRVPLPLLGFGTVAGLFTTGLFLLQRGKQPFYFIAVLSAAAFLCAFAFFALLAFGAQGTARKRILFAAAGLCFGLGFLCRVNTMIPAAFLIATAVLMYGISHIKNKKGIPALLLDLGCLVLPVAAAMGVAFGFNYIRFGSLLEFGATYQLTVSDISKNKIYLGGIIGAFYHYFIQNFSTNKIFPYIRLSTMHMTDYYRDYTYVDSNFGLFNIPLYLLMLLFGTETSHQNNRREPPLVTAGVISLFITAFLNFCLGGVIFRYLGDISFAGAFLCLAILFHLLQVPKKQLGKVQKLLYGTIQGLGILLTAVSLILSGALGLSFSANLLPLSPEGYTFIAALFTVT